MKKSIKIVSLSAIALLTLMALLWIFLAESSPGSSLDKARTAIAEAKEKGAGKYAPQLLGQAEDLYQQALVSWKRENKRLRIFRHYDAVISLSEEAAGVAVLAANASTVGSGRMKLEIKERIDTLKREVEIHRNRTSLVPLTGKLKELDATASLRLTEAGISYDREDYPAALRQILQAEQAYKKLFQENESLLTGYFRDFDKWEKWVNAAIRSSKKNQSVAIVVDKIGHKCLVYSKGRLLYTFDAELGTNWLGDKQHQGDKATPEGEYHVTARLSGSQTKYYRALLINYPNEEDQQRYADNLQNGRIPRGKDIGGAVEIHGNGGRGFDWTNGCVALSDSDADKIYRISKVGTPVIIVGSTKPLEELLNE